MFIYKNKNSDKIHLEIVGNLTFTAPLRDIEILNGRFTEFDKMFSYPFPSLKTGENIITFSDNVEEIYLVPRLGALIS